MAPTLKKIEADHKKLLNKIKKKANNIKKRAEKAKLDEIFENFNELKGIFENQTEKTKNYNEITSFQPQTNRETNLNLMLGGDIPEKKTNLRIGSNLRNMYDKETENAKKGVEMTHDILDKVRGINTTLDEVTDLVRLQRQKLLSIQTQIGESQSIMKRSQKIIRSFSKELYQDKIIKILLGTISVVLILIMISAIQYKMKSGELIGKQIKTQEELQDFTDIDENLFWKTVIEEVEPKTSGIVTDEELKTRATRKIGGLDLMKLDELRKQSGIYKDKSFKQRKNYLI
jgi:hypothetical protein